MTNADFIRNFRFVANVLGIWEYDETAFSEAELDATARRCWRLWLIPELFEGYEILSVQREEVADQVRQLRTIADLARGKGRPTVKQVRIARELCRKLYRHLNFVFHSDNSYELLRDCRRLVFDPTDVGVARWVLAADIQIGTDSLGDPAVKVWLIVDDGDFTAEGFWPEWDALRWRVLDRLWKRVDEDRRVSVSLRVVSEVVERLSGVSA